MSLTKVKSQVLGILNPALGVTSGGTGLASLTSNSVVLGNGSNPVQLIAPGNSGNVLTSNGTTWTSSALGVIGIDQTWQNVTANRVAGTTYTNNTGKPIMVMITTYKIGSSPRTDFYVGNVIIGFTDGTGTNDVGNHTAASFIVPNGSTYQVTSGFIQWSELR
jgi:hypothetical protein